MLIHNYRNHFRSMDWKDSNGNQHHSNCFQNFNNTERETKMEFEQYLEELETKNLCFFLPVRINKVTINKE